jgi:hypothetical protein
VGNANFSGCERDLPPIVRRATPWSALGNRPNARRTAAAVTDKKFSSATAGNQREKQSVSSRNLRRVGKLFIVFVAQPAVQFTTREKSEADLRLARSGD